MEGSPSKIEVTWVPGTYGIYKQPNIDVSLSHVFCVMNVIWIVLWHRRPEKHGFYTSKNWKILIMAITIGYKI